MWTPRRIIDAVSDATIGTAIVMVHLVMAERARSRRGSPTGSRSEPTDPIAIRRFE
jgi:hypothetical protein